MVKKEKDLLTKKIQSTLTKSIDVLHSIISNEMGDDAIKIDAVETLLKAYSTLENKEVIE